MGAPEESACLTFRAKRKQNLSSYFFFFISFLVCVCVPVSLTTVYNRKLNLEDSVNTTIILILIILLTTY